MSKPDIEVTALPADEAEKRYGYSKWVKWGCGVSTFDWASIQARRRLTNILKGRVLVTPTGDWASCKPTEVKAGDLVVFPDGMTCK